ncbi:hypothetical protein RI367_007761 [Sorochytrium milnesiophthora]
MLHSDCPLKPDVFTGKSQDIEHFLAEVDNYLGLLCPQATADNTIRVVVSFLDKGLLSWYRVSAFARPILALDSAVFLEALRTQYDGYGSAAMAEFQMNNMNQSPSQKTVEYVDKFEEATYLAPVVITETMRATACRRSLLPNVIAGHPHSHRLKNLCRPYSSGHGTREAACRSPKCFARPQAAQHVLALRTKPTSDYPVSYLVEQQPTDATSPRQLMEQQTTAERCSKPAAASGSATRPTRILRVVPNPSLAEQPTAMDVNSLQGNQHLEDRVLCQKRDILRLSIAETIDVPDNDDGNVAASLVDTSGGSRVPSLKQMDVDYQAQSQYPSKRSPF